MGLSGEQKRTTRTNASTARTTTRKTGRTDTATTTRTVASKPTRKAAAAARTTRKAGGSATRRASTVTATATNGAARTNGTKPAATRKAAKKSARRAGKAVTPVLAKNGATNGTGLDPDYLKPTTIERRKSKINGWGVFALEDIPKNKRIVYYAGERISAKESGPREERYLERGHIWCFQLNRAWVIDAAIGGNIARFVNHACKPNCYTHIVDGTIWIRAGKSIRKGEELTYNYYTEGQAEIPCRCVPGCQGML